MISELLSTEYCSDASPVFFGLLDFSIAPPLLYYSYIPILLFSLFVGVRVFVRGRNNPVAHAFSWLVLAFAFMVCVALIGWIGAPVWLVAWSWALSDLAAVTMFLLAARFLRVFLTGKSAAPWIRNSLIALALPVLVLLPTKQNIAAFDHELCQGLYGTWLHDYAFVLEGVFIVYMIGVALLAMKRKTLAVSIHKAIFVSLSVVMFLVIFLASTVLASDDSNYIYELFGNAGAAILFGGITYLLSDDDELSLGMSPPEMLTIMLGFIVGAMLFVRNISNVRIAASVSLGLVIFVGIALAQSVRRERRQLKEIEQLAGRLKSVNRIMSHDVKSVLNKDKMLMDALLDGGFGDIPEGAKSLISRADRETGNMLEAIMTILSTGQDLVLHKEQVDLKKEVESMVEVLTPDARAKGLALHLDVDFSAPVIVNADPMYMRVHVIKNLILNAILYTQTGSVTVRLAHTPENTVRLSVQDTGVGIAPEDASVLFKEGGHGAHSLEINVHSTGYGLFSAKRIVDAHGGRIWFMSPGVGKGTTFFVELPVA